MYASPPAVDVPKDATRLEAEGPHSELSSGNWHLKTEAHGEYGTTISVSFGSGLTFDKERARKDALNLGLSSSCLDRKSFTSSMQGARKCAFGEDKSAELHLTGDAILCFIPPKEKGKNTTAFMISEDGLEHIEEDEAKLLLDGVPRSMVEEVLQAERNRINVAETDSEVSSSNASSRPSSSRPRSSNRPLSRKGRESARRPTSAGSGRPYSASRPSSSGSVRHTNNIDDVGMGEAELKGVAGRAVGDMDDEEELEMAHSTHGNLLFSQGMDAYPRQG